MYKRHRFPPEIIQHVVWLYHRFNLSSRDIEDLMAERGIAISYESIRLWCIKFGSKYAKRLLRANVNEPRRIVTDKLRSYGVAHRELIPDTVHDTAQYANNRAELSHQPTRVRERGMRKSKSVSQAQRFLSNHAAVYNLFNLGRDLISAEHYRIFRARSLPLGYNAPLRLGNVPQPSSSRIQRKPFEAES